MNETVTLPQLISKLAAQANCSPAAARRFIHDLFAGVEQALNDGRSIIVAGIGEFAPGLDAAHPVLFHPDSKLAAALNEPFEAFTAIELPEGMDDDMTLSDEETVVAEENHDDAAPEAIVEESNEQPIEELAEEPVDDPISVEETPQTPVAEEDMVDKTISEEKPLEVPDTPVVSDEDESEDDSERMTYAPAQTHSPGIWLTCGILIGLIIGLIGGYFAGNAIGRYHLPDDTDEYYDDADTTEMPVPEIEPVTSVQQIVQPKDTIAAEAAPSTVPSNAVVAATPVETTVKEPVYDTITSTQFLTTLARKHYGVKNYWIFIYEDNPGLGNPNNIRPGTKIRIPDRADFEEATPEATKEKARQHLNNLARKYKL